MAPITVTVNGLADMLIICKTKLYRLHNQGSTRSFMLVNRRFVLIEDIDKLVHRAIEVEAF
ncbi:hypothetical protein [Sphingomonas sp. CROZ-RG-20F-R02-07]|uniref:hypothetical protein n=1 Tax=Sphingomonas sp. CROZ-RG-20F-R02-07 TaxID=2914832 RepID=UPI001F571D36|nr:hypothetical protein [Sphingomonas sp. CROZ-RG-20F-R02-07]